MKFKRVILVLLISAVSCSVLAHRMKVFAWAELDEIHGQAYFAGADAAEYAEIELLLDGKLLTHTTADAKGDFIFKSLKPGAYQVRADAGQGHFSTMDVQLGHLAGKADVSPDAQNASSVIPGQLSEQQLSELISRSVNQAVLPLRQQLDQYEAKTRLHDILGGLGYLVGIFGLWMALSRRKNAGASEDVTEHHQSS